MRLISDAQLAANRENAQKSTGPTTHAGLAASCLNNRRHGLSGAFCLLEGEDKLTFTIMHDAFHAQYQPENATEVILVERMVEYQWLTDRALRFQQRLFLENPGEPDEKKLALYLRYQTTHERAFSRCLADLLKLRAEKRKQEIGFESQKQKQAAESRREANENRRAAAEKRAQDRHEWDLRLAEAKVSHQEVLTLNAEMDGDVIRMKNPGLKTSQTAA